MSDAKLPARRKLLIVSPYSIMPAIHGGAVRMANLIRRLTPTYDVLVLVLIGGTDDPGQRRALSGLGAQPFFQQFAELADHPDVDGYFSPVIAERILCLARAHGADLIQLEYTELGAYATTLRGKIPVVLVEHDIAFRSFERQRALKSPPSADNTEDSSPINGDRLRALELEACLAADLIHVCSDDDRDYLAAQLEDGTRRLRVIPNGVDTTHYRPPEAGAERRGALFVGSFPHKPNLDALQWLVDRIWPKVRHHNPNATLTVVGARPPAWVNALDGANGISVAGEVEDVLPYYTGHQVLLAPIRAGSGTRLKILEAMACGIPVVSTTLGAEGLDLDSGRHVLLADDEKSFAEAASTVLNASDEMSSSLANAAREIATSRYDWDSVADAATSTYSELLNHEPARPEIAVTRQIDFSTSKPTVSVIVHGSETKIPRQTCLESLAAQEVDFEFEVIWAGSEQPPQSAAPDLPLVQLQTDPTASPGTTLNRAVQHARGEVFVFLEANARPADRLWLTRLAAPFTFPRPPAAVHGAVRARRSLLGRTFNPWFTAESVGWQASWGGALFSIVNGAVHRDAWRSHPFSEDCALADRRWQRQAHLARYLVQPCLDALVHQYLDDSLLTLAGRWYNEGQIWRQLGKPYSLGNAAADLWRCTGLGGRPRPGFPLQLAPPTRVLALWAGSAGGRPSKSSHRPML